MENLDTNIDPNIPESRDKIAAWVKAVGDSAESQGLEVKSSLEFSRSERKKSFTKITKFILASANRDQNHAMRDYRGYGVMLIGVTKDEVCGLENIPEQHEFEGAARSYFGSAVPKYRFVTHAFEGKNLLFVIVDPPVNGQEIYVCSGSYDADKRVDQLRDGAIYCRESTQTIEANSVQVRDMINRLLGGYVDINLGVSEIFAGPRVDADFLKNLYSYPKEKYNEFLRKKTIENKRSNSLWGNSWIIKDPLHHISVKDMLEAYRNDEKRYEECFNRLLELNLKPAIFSVINTGSKVLENPFIEYRFSGDVYLVNLEDEDYECKDFEIFPFMAVPQYYFMRPYGLMNIRSSNFTQVGDSRVVTWRPGSISPGQTVTSEEDNIGIFVNADNVNTGVFYRVTDPNLQRPIEGEINVSMINVDPSNIFENVEF